MLDEEYICFKCGGIFPSSFEHQVFKLNDSAIGIVVCKPCMRGTLMKKKQRRANNKKANIRRRRKDRNRIKHLERLKKKESSLDFMSQFMKIFEGMDFSSLEGSEDGEVSEEDTQKMMEQFSKLFGGEGLADLDLGDLGFGDDESLDIAQEAEEVTVSPFEEEDEGLPTGSE